MSTTTAATQISSISISLLASGGIAALSAFDIPELQAQPASRSLPSIRWLFSRGSYIFPRAVVISFVYLAHNAFPASLQSVTQLLKITSNSGTVNGYLVAAALSIGIAPVTVFLIMPTNIKLIKLNERKGCARSERSASAKRGTEGKERSAEDSVAGKGEAEVFTDLVVLRVELPREAQRRMMK